LVDGWLSRSWRVTLAVLLAIIVMSVKEVSLLFPFVASVAIFSPLQAAGHSLTQRLIATGRRTWPFYLLAAGYFVVRALVLDGIARPQTVVTPVEHLLTAPSIMVFYLRQALMPLEPAPLYPIDVVSPDNLALSNFWLPLAALFVVGPVAHWLAKGSEVNGIGLALFLFPLLPAFSISAFSPEQLVHNRYLYVPPLGVLMIVVSTVAEFIRKRLEWASHRADAAFLEAIAIQSIPLLFQTVRYNTAWSSDVA
jgi:hypothetical protein